VHAGEGLAGQLQELPMENFPVVPRKGLPIVKSKTLSVAMDSPQSRPLFKHFSESMKLFRCCWQPCWIWPWMLLDVPGMKIGGILSAARMRVKDKVASLQSWKVIDFSRWIR
jgi:hypothetical protein